MNFLELLGERIKKRIRERGYASVELFAHENRIPKSTLSELLNGKNDPKFTTLAKISSGLEISLSELLQDPAIDQWVREIEPRYIAKTTKPRPVRGNKKPSAARHGGQRLKLDTL